MNGSVRLQPDRAVRYSSVPRMPLTAGTKLGPYEILAPLGAGGMGEVYRARDIRLDRTVAIKVLPEALEGDSQFRDRFEREARTISQLNHPNICILHDVGHEQGVTFLVLEFLEGETLEQRLARGPLKMDEALKLGLEVAKRRRRSSRRMVGGLPFTLMMGSSSSKQRRRPPATSCCSIRRSRRSPLTGRRMGAVFCFKLCPLEQEWICGSCRALGTASPPRSSKRRRTRRLGNSRRTGAGSRINPTNPARTRFTSGRFRSRADSSASRLAGGLDRVGDATAESFSIWGRTHA